MSTFSENFRQYRKLRGATQEETGQVLGVAFQTVSKWERGECWPDVTLLPAIAAYFDVSIDALFGMRQLRDRKRLNDAYAQAHALSAAGKLAEALAVLEEVYPVFPNEYGLLSELALVLAQIGGSAYLERAAGLMGCVLAESNNTKLCGTSRAALCYIYCKTGEREKAEALAKQLPHMRESREIVLPYVQSGGDKDYDALLRELQVGGCGLMPVTVQYLTKELSSRLDLAERMYQIIARNMQAVFGSERTPQNKALWIQNRIHAATQAGETTLLLQCGETLCGYLQYYREAELCIWSEMEIALPFQGDGRTFRAMIKAFLEDPGYQDCTQIRVYINDANKKAQAVARHIGFDFLEHHNNGARYIAARDVLAAY